MKLNRKKAVIPDLDGTLMDSMRMWKATDVEYPARFGLTCPDGLQKETEGISLSEIAVYLREWFQSKETLDEIKNAWIQMSIKKYRKEVPLKPGAGVFLEFISGRGLVAGIAIDNERAMVDVVLDSPDIRRYSKVMATACEVAASKSAPDICLNVAERPQMVPEDCVVFEDTPAGIQAGKNAGMTVLAVEDAFLLEMKEGEEKLVDYHIRDHYKLLDGVAG